MRKERNVNAVLCLRCGTVAASYHRHDFRTCLCGEVAVDGGFDYWRSLGDPKDMRRLNWYEKIEDLKSVEPDGLPDSGSSQSLELGPSEKGNSPRVRNWRWKEPTKKVRKLRKDLPTKASPNRPH